MMTPLAGRLSPLGSTRRAFTPAAIAGLKAWFDAGTLALVDNAAVSSWTDSAGVVPNATQTTPANQPVYKTNILNGQPVVRFTVAKWLSFVSTALQIASKTIVAVGGVDVAPSSVRGLISAATANWYAGVSSTSQQLFSGANTAGTQRTFFSPSAAFTLGVCAIHTYRVEVSGSNVTRGLYKNGALLGSSALTDGYGVVTASTWIVGAFATGGTSGWPGDIAELLVYDTALSDADRLTLERHLGSKYGIGVA